MTNMQVVEEFLRGNFAKSENLTSWSVGKLESYSTIIGEKSKGRKMYINGTFYSQTTAKHLSYFRRLAARHGFKLVWLYGLPEGVQSLARYASKNSL